MCQNGHNAVKKACGNLVGNWEIGQESGLRNVTYAQKMARRGVAGKGSRSKGCRVQHMARVAPGEYGAVARSAALESAVQLGTTKQTGKPTWPTLRNVGFATDALARDREASARREAVIGPDQS
jgi:hypothetical protein